MVEEIHMRLNVIISVMIMSSMFVTSVAAAATGGSDINHPSSLSQSLKGLSREFLRDLEIVGACQKKAFATCKGKQKLKYSICHQTTLDNCLKKATIR